MSASKKHLTYILIPSVAVVLAVLTNVPLIYAYAHQAPHLKFMGIIAGVRDSNFYFMMMKQTGGWWPVLHNYFAAGEPNEIYHGFFWFFLGKIARAFGMSDLAAYHGARIAAAIVSVPVFYYFLSRFLSSIAERVAGLLMLLFGAGAGWILLLRYYRNGTMPLVPADVGTPEASSFFTLLTFPHLSVALVLIALCFALLQDSISRERLRSAAGAGVCGLALGFIHVVNLLVIYAALASYALLSLIFLRERRPTRSAIIFGAFSVWPIAYYLYLSLVKPELLPQVPVRSAGPLVYLIGFAPFALLSLLYVLALIRRRYLPRGDLLLICWVLTNFLMLYSHPLVSQEARTVLGLQLPLAALSARALFVTVLPALGLDWWMSGRLEKKIPGMLVAVLIVGFTFPTTYCNIIERVSRLRDYPEAFSLTDDEYEALRFLHKAPGMGVVLSGDAIGNYVPRLARKYSWLGQYDLPSHDFRLNLARKFFAEETPDPIRQDFLKHQDIEYIYYGRDERKFGGFDPGGAPYLKRVFRNSTVDIYETDFEDASGQGLVSL